MKDFLLGIFLLAFGLALVLSDRDWVLSEQPRIAPVADIPAGVDVAQLDRFLTEAGLHMSRTFRPGSGLRPSTFGDVGALAGLVHDRSGVGRVRIGYSIREFAILRLPLVPIKQFGYVLYRDEGNGWTALYPLAGGAGDLLQRQSGRDLTTGFILPFWRYCWGWGIVALLALWLWVRHRDTMMRREALGLI